MLSTVSIYLSIYLSIYGGVVEGGGGGPRVDGGAPTTPNQLWGGPACKSLRTPVLDQMYPFNRFLQREGNPTSKNWNERKSRG